MSLERFLARCQADTKRLISPHTAAGLSRWRECQTQAERVDFVRRLIRSEAGRRNGWAIDQAGGVSLESIVLDHQPDHFNEEDRRIAKQTLGRVEA